MQVSKAETFTHQSDVGRVAASGASGSHKHTKIQAIGKTFGALCGACWDSGVACVSLASLIFSICGLLVKLTDNRVPVFQIVATRSLVSFSMCALAARLAQPPISPLFGHRAQLHLLLGRGLCGAAAMTTSYLAISALPLADAITLFFFNPATTAVAAYFLLAEPLGLKGLGGVFISLAGLVLLTQPPFIFGGDPWDATRMWGTVYGLASAVLATGAFIFIRLIGIKEEAVVLSVYFNSASFLTSSIPLAVGYPSHAVLPGGVDTALLLGISVGSFAAQILIGRGFQLMHAAKASAVNFSQVIYSYLLGMIFLHEQLSLLGGAGSALVAAGVVLVNMRPRAVKPPPSTPPAAEVEGSSEAATLLPGSSATAHLSSGGQQPATLKLTRIQTSAADSKGAVTVTIQSSRDGGYVGVGGGGMGESSEEKDWTGRLSMGLAHTLSMIGTDRASREDGRSVTAAQSSGVPSRAASWTSSTSTARSSRAVSTVIPVSDAAQTTPDLSRHLSSRSVASLGDQASGREGPGMESDRLLGQDGVRSDAVGERQTQAGCAHMQSGTGGREGEVGRIGSGVRESWVEIPIHSTSDRGVDRQLETRRLLG